MIELYIQSLKMNFQSAHLTENGYAVVGQGKYTQLLIHNIK